jgi:hypothetical protein
MIVGFALIAADGLISMSGFGITSVVAVRGVRRWLRAQQEPPVTVAKRKIAQAKAATAAASSAGSSAWQNGLAHQRSH